MTNEKIVYSTELGGTCNLHEREAAEDRVYEAQRLDDFMFSDPVSLQEEIELALQENEAAAEDYWEQQHLDYEEGLLDCGCNGCLCHCELTEEDILHYDNNCEDYEERKRERLAEEQEY